MSRLRAATGYRGSRLHGRLSVPRASRNANNGPRTTDHGRTYFESRLKYSSSPARNSSGREGARVAGRLRRRLGLHEPLSRCAPPPKRASAESSVLPCPPPPGVAPPPPPPLGLIRFDCNKSSMASVSAAIAGAPFRATQDPRRLAHHCRDLGEQANLVGKLAFAVRQFPNVERAACRPAR